MIWFRPGVEHTAPPLVRSTGGQNGPVLDTALFDIDGVLIDASRSYRLSVMAAADHLVREVNGLGEAPTPLLTPEDVALFKLAGGFNNDWDETRLLAAIWTARLREWRGSPEAQLPLAYWAEKATEASAAGRGGVRWMLDTFPASAIPDANAARWAHDEFYWGSQLVFEHYGRQPEFAPGAEGFVQNEELLLEETVLPSLRALGIRHFGIITGRVGPEVTRAVERLTAGSGLAEVEESRTMPGESPFGVVIAGTQYAKPDPEALRVALDALSARGGFYIGDTADDLDLVLRYRQTPQASHEDAPPMLSIIVASSAARTVFQDRGADIVLDSVGELPLALRLLDERARQANHSAEHIER